MQLWAHNSTSTFPKKIVTAFLILATSVSNMVGQDVAYNWYQAKIGPGGFTLGFAIADDGTSYVRGDTEGVFKWTGTSWTNLMYWTTPGSPHVPFVTSVPGADEMAVQPNNSSTVFIAAMPGTDAGGTGIYRSMNGGATWSKVFPDSNISENFPDKLRGERLAIDRQNPAVIYHANRASQLWCSLSGGNVGSWNQITSGLPTTGGFRMITIDPNQTYISSGVTRSKTVYVAVNGSGIYRSIDGGISFALLPGSPTDVYRMDVLSSGGLLVGHGAGIARFNGSNFADVTPPGYTNKAFIIAVKRTDPSKAVAVQVVSNGASFFRSTNGGASWSSPLTIGSGMTKSDEVPWVQRPWAVNATDLKFNPVNGELLLSECYNLWATPNPFAPTVAWTNQCNGLELTAITNVTSPPVGAALLLSGAQDDGGWRHTDLTSYPAETTGVIDTPTEYSTENPGIDYCGTDSSKVVFSYTAQNYQGYVYVSTDNGVSATKTKSSPFSPDSYVGGAKVAVSATSYQNIVYWAGSQTPRYTTNGGQNWYKSNIISSSSPTVSGPGFYYDQDYPIVSDKVVGGLFYLVSRDASTVSPRHCRLYISGDGGANFTERSVFVDAPTSPDIAAAPKTAGYVAVGAGAGFYVSTNANTSAPTFSSLPGWDSAYSPSWGAAGPSGNPTLFVSGKRTGNAWGVYRSEDLGVTWKRISAANPGNVPAGAIAADGRTFGRVYVMSGGGLLVGDQSN